MMDTLTRPELYGNIEFELQDYLLKEQPSFMEDPPRLELKFTAEFLAQNPDVEIAFHPCYGVTLVRKVPAEKVRAELLQYRKDVEARFKGIHRMDTSEIEEDLAQLREHKKSLEFVGLNSPFGINVAKTLFAMCEILDVRIQHRESSLRRKREELDREEQWRDGELRWIEETLAEIEEW